MSAVISLGKFTKVPLIEAWPAEDRNFTPWLAAPDAIRLLGEALDMDLAVEGVEHWVGPFRADILARVQDESDHLVVVENQFGRTDHGHLGQILTYLAGIDHAKTVVWIAETIQADHRAAIDWLNNHTEDEFSFFAVEIELWRIDDSPPAPRFNVVASPNDWTKQARAAARQAGEVELAERHHTRMAYWSSFGAFLKAKGAQFQIRRVNKDHWFSFAIGRAGFNINALISVDKSWIGVDVAASNDLQKVAYRALYAEREVIEKEFGEPLEWRESPGKKSWRIVLLRQNSDPGHDAAREDQHAWMLTKMERFKAVFANRIKGLDLTRAATGEEDEPE